MKRIKGLLGAVLSICMLVCVWNLDAYAATGSLSVLGKSGTVGSTVTVTGTVSASEAIGAVAVTLTYDPSGLQYVGGSDGVEPGPGSVTFFADLVNKNKTSVSFNISFKILKEGSFTVSGVANAGTDADMPEKISIPAGGGTITGKAVTTNNPSGGGTTTPTNPGTPAANKDTNNKLKSLQVSPGSLSPTFNTNTTSYTVNVPEGTTQIVVSAAAQSNKANVSVTGHKNIKPGENTVKVVVLAESGATRVYTLTVICGEATTNEEPQEEPEKIQINGTDYTINEAFADDMIPAGFVRTKVTYKEKEYEALKHEKSELLLVNLQNEAVNAFYIFNAETQEFYDFIQISFSGGRYIIPLTLDDREEFSGSDTTTITLQDKPFDAWKVDEDYSIIRAMDSEGKIVLYQYDSLDGTLQRYIEVVEQEPVEEPEETKLTFFSFLEKYHLYIIAGLGIVILGLIISLICVVVIKKNKQGDESDHHTEGSYVEQNKQTKKVEKQPKEVETHPKKRKHDARRRKAIKRLQKQQMRENR